ncbi:MAG: hypothetical protein OEY37_00055 [Gammaproteobacteria bacterium]|nr:hypothetical protein [Gammaproteobacteria bacterium]MDH5617209.1 hypothetical protein [Gammaproteobacteria bacterium]
MYIPKPIYDYAPYYWLVVGLLLILLGFRVGSEGGQMFQYFSVSLGALSAVWGVRILLRRRERQRLDALETLPTGAPPE